MRYLFGFIAKHYLAAVSLSFLLFIGISCGMKTDDAWKNDLGNKRLTFVNNSGSISDKIDIWFCDSGIYAKRIEFTGVSGEFTMADADMERGYWNIESGVLRLQSEHNKISEYTISQYFDNDVLQLNGKNYRISTHNECGN